MSGGHGSRVSLIEMNWLLLAGLGASIFAALLGALLCVMLSQPPLLQTADEACALRAGLDGAGYSREYSTHTELLPPGLVCSDGSTSFRLATPLATALGPSLLLGGLSTGLVQVFILKRLYPPSQPSPDVPFSSLS